MDNSSSNLLTVPEVAERLRLGVVTIKRLIKRGELNAIKLGPNTVRVAESDLTAYLASRRS